MGTYRMICKNVRQNNGVQQAHLTSEFGPGEQPTEVLWNGTAGEFVSGAEYIFNVNRSAVRRSTSDMES